MHVVDCFECIAFINKNMKDTAFLYDYRFMTIEDNETGIITIGDIFKYFEKIHDGDENFYKNIDNVISNIKIT